MTHDRFRELLTVLEETPETRTPARIIWDNFYQTVVCIRGFVRGTSKENLSREYALDRCKTAITLLQQLWVISNMTGSNTGKYVCYDELIKEIKGHSMDTLIEKNALYAPDDDALHNFNVGGNVFDGTPEEALWGYLTKHLVALFDMVEKNDFSNHADFLEKCQDSINYFRFLYCIWIDHFDEFDREQYQINEARGFAPRDLYTPVADEELNG